MKLTRFPLTALAIAVLAGCTGGTSTSTVIPSTSDQPLRANSLALIRPLNDGPPIVFCGADPATALRRCAPFSAIAPVIPDVLPPHRPGPVCTHGWVLTFGFPDGSSVTYHPCALPPSIAVVKRAALYYLRHQQGAGLGAGPG